MIVFFQGVFQFIGGAQNVEKYLPSDTYIDMRKFNSLEEMDKFINSISEKEYYSYLKGIEKYLLSDAYKETFDVNAFVDNMCKLIIS